MGKPMGYDEPPALTYDYAAAAERTRSMRCPPLMVLVSTIFLIVFEWALFEILRGPFGL